MTSRLLVVPGLCALLAFSACSKSHDAATESTTTTSVKDAKPAANATRAADSEGDTNTSQTSAPTTAPAAEGDGASGFITLPVYPGATELKDQSTTMSTNDGSFAVMVYTTKDDAKKVADWYKSHLPQAWKGGILTSGDKTVGTFSNEAGDGEQSVVVANESDGATRIQLSTKHGK
ncbi:MAG: hypothetical protein NVS3B7_01030 [Candidatus Elarobacter sp.]